MDTVFSVEVGGNETQFTLRELQPNQAYQLRIAAGTGIGFGVPSEWAQHQTLAHYNHSDHSMGKADCNLFWRLSQVCRISILLGLTVDMNIISLIILSG